MDNGFPDWIKPVELMPIKHTDVLGYIVDKVHPSRTRIYMVGLLDGGWWVRYSEGSMPLQAGEITHWRYLPEPPRMP
jgi:hypothetical protein